jgi:hypothetical protein
MSNDATRNEKIKSLVGRVLDHRLKSLETDQHLTKINIEVFVGKRSNDPVKVRIMPTSEIVAGEE